MISLNCPIFPAPNCDILTVSERLEVGEGERGEEEEVATRGGEGLVGEEVSEEVCWGLVTAIDSLVSLIPSPLLLEVAGHLILMVLPLVLLLLPLPVL